MRQMVGGSALRAGREVAYVQRYGLQDVPFSTTPNPAYAYANPSMLDGLRRMRKVVLGRVGFGMISGEVGLGKTTLARTIQNDLQTRNLVVASFPAVPGGARQSEASIFREIALGFGLSRRSGNSADAYFDAISNFALELNKMERTAVVIIDDAQELKQTGSRALLRLQAMQTMSDQLVQIILLGQNPEMWDAVYANRALHTRLADQVELKPFTPEDVAKMVEFRLHVAGREEPLFTEEATALLGRVSRGIPRIVCRTAHAACELAADRDSDMVELRDIEAAAADLRHDGTIDG